MSFDREKFKRLVHYVIWRAGHRDGFGATKLNKVLWFSEARAYVLTGKPITGATYVRQKHGPVPREFMPIRHELEVDKLIRVVEPRTQYEHTQFTALRPADASFLSDAERQTVEFWINHIDQEHTATSISEESHDYAWEIAEMGEVVPYYAILSERVRDPNDAELAWAAKRAKELGLP
jgi:hypothetical protein